MAAALLTSGQENYLRLVKVVLRTVPDNLRNLFKTEFAKTYGKPYGDDTVSGMFFLNKVIPRNRKKLNAHVESTIQNGDSASFDCSTLFYCILYSQALKLPLMRKKNARVPPLNTSELIEQLREQRNLLAHSPNAEIDQPAFNATVADLTAIYQQLGWPCTDLLQAANYPVSTAECDRLQQELMKEVTRNNDFDKMVQKYDQELLTVKGDVQDFASRLTDAEAGERSGSSFETLFRNTEVDRFNKTHTGLLKELQQKKGEEFVQGLPQIRMFIDDEKFCIGEEHDDTRVYVGLLCDGRKAAVKRMKNHQYSCIRKEVEMLATLKHENIVSYMVTENDKTHHYIATELCDYTIHQMVKRKDVTALEPKDWIKEAAPLVKGLLTGLDYMHTLEPRKILHRDIKPRNVFVVVSTSGKKCIKIANFDLSRRLQPGQSAIISESIGTQYWLPREILDQMYGKEELTHKYKASCDIQSAGMVCFFIMSRGTHPYAADGDNDLIRYRVRRGMHDLAKVEEEDPVASDLVKRMLAHEPLHRPSAGELLSHPYLWKDRRDFLRFVGSLDEIKFSHDCQEDPLVKAVEATKPPPLDGGQEHPAKNPVCSLLTKIWESGDHDYKYHESKWFLEVYRVIESNDEWSQRPDMKKFFPSPKRTQEM